MNKIIIPTLLLLAVPTFGAQIKEATCFDLERVAENITPQFLAAEDGYNRSGKKDSGEVDIGEIVAESEHINKECLKNNDSKIAGLQDDMRAVAVVHSTETLNAFAASCKDFMALGADAQPVAVFWVAGHEKAGPIKKGEFNQKLLESSISDVLRDCKNEPTGLFYVKVKAWIKDSI